MSFFPIVVLVIIVGQVHKLLKKYGQGDTREIVSDFLNTVVTANKIGKTGGPKGKKESERLMKAFMTRRFPKLKTKLAGVNKQGTYKDAVSSSMSKKDGLLVKNSDFGRAGQGVPQSAYGKPAIQPDSGILRIIVMIFALLLFIGFGLAIYSWFGMSL